MDSDDLPVSFKISERGLMTCLNNVIEAARRYWDGQLLSHFTNHGLDHSERLVDILGRLLEDHLYLLNEYERFILLASLYLHDLGMQSPTHAGLPKKSQYSWDELDIIRERHNESSSKMILESISSKSELNLGLDQCKEFAGFIATVSRYHRKLDINEVADTSLAGEPIRLRLLISLIRLGDALDQDYRRVNMDILKLRDIPVESKYHWWSHHYVSSVLIEKGKISLFFRFPVQFREDDVVKVFTNRVHESINKQFLEVYYILDNYWIRLYRDVELGGVDYYPDSALELVPDDLLEHINKDIIKITKGVQELSRRTGTIYYVDGVPYSDDIEAVKCLSKVIQYLLEGKTLDAVKELKRCWVFTVAPKERTIILNLLGNCYYIMGRLDEAERCLRDILSISERKDLKEIYEEEVLIIKSSALGNIGLIYRAKGDLDEALKYHQDALEIHREVGYRQGEASDLGNIGLIYRAKGDLDEALKYHQDALEIHREVGYRQGEANQLGNIGLIYRAKGDLDEALKYLEDALEIDREVGYRQGEANQLGNIGLIYRAKGDLDEALKYLEDALEIHREVGYRQGEASALGNIGLIYRAKGDLDEALKYHQDALEIDREVGYRQGEASDLGNIGLTYSDKGDLDEALKYLEDALEIFRIAAPQYVVQTLRNISTIYKEMTRFEKVFEYSAKAISSSLSQEQFNNAFFGFLLIVKEMIINDEWEKLEQINIIYTSGIITDKNLKQFFTSLYKYAIYNKTKSESHKKEYELEENKLIPELRNILNNLLEKPSSYVPSKNYIV